MLVGIDHSRKLSVGQGNGGTATNTIILPNIQLRSNVIRDLKNNWKEMHDMLTRTQEKVLFRNHNAGSPEVMEYGYPTT